MDGIAIRFLAWKKGLRTFEIEGMQTPGKKAGALFLDHFCWEVMTGAPIPKGCDCVIPYEWLSINQKNRMATVESGRKLQQFQFIHQQGRDCQKGEILLSEGVRLQSPEIAIAASAGCSALKVSQPLSVAIVSTGDELIDVGKSINEIQVRRSNGYTIEAALYSSGFLNTKRYHCCDQFVSIYDRVKKVLSSHDVLIVTGGVSAGKFDFIPDVLAKLKIQKAFHKVLQRPGWPMFFGYTKRHQPVFGLPGNPVSALICCHYYVIPALRKMMGEKSFYITKNVLLKDDVPVQDSSLTYFLPVRLEGVSVRMALTTNSGNVIPLAQTDGFIKLPSGREKFFKGEEVEFIEWK